MRDNLADPGTDLDTGTAGYQTEVPVVRWDPVPGAASYELQIADWTGSAVRLGDGGLPEEDLGAGVDAARHPRRQPRRLAGHARHGLLCDDHARHVTASASARAATAPPATRRSGATTRTSRTATPTRPRRSAPRSPGRPTRIRPSGSASAPCAFGYPCSADYLEPVVGSTTTPDAALHLEAALRREQLLRRRRQGRELQQRGRRGLHAHPGLRAAQLAQADDLPRRDDDLLLGGPAGRRRPTAPTRSPLDLPNSAKGTFQKQSTPPTCSRRSRCRPSSTSRPSAGRRRSARAATASRSRPTRPSAPARRRASPTRPRTRATRPTRPTPSSTGASAPTTRT